MHLNCQKLKCSFCREGAPVTGMLLYDIIRLYIQWGSLGHKINLKGPEVINGAGEKGKKTQFCSTNLCVGGY